MQSAQQNLDKWRNLALSGPIAAALFLASVIGFAALRNDGYTHGTKAVSELGAVGAPMAGAFNLFGFALPGLLIVILALSIAKLNPSKDGRISITLLGMSGLSMFLAGLFPFDMSDRWGLSSTLHGSSAMLSGVFWAFSLWGLGAIFRKQFGMTLLGRMTPWFLLFLVLNLGWQIAWQATGYLLPGWGQRIGFVGFFIWSSWVGVEIYRTRLLRNEESVSSNLG